MSPARYVPIRSSRASKASRIMRLGVEGVKVPNETPYNPLDIDHLGESVAEALLRRSVVALSDLQPFNGAGVYAIYYTGENLPFEPYAQLANVNATGAFEMPIYVGKAVPSGARKGRRVLTAPGPALFKRLSEHVQSITQAQNLALMDFHCRYLVVADIWIPLGESLLIERFSPLWNVVVDGFGNHDPGSGRGAGQRPMWDTIHPGRPWAERLAPNRRSEEAILEMVRAALGGGPAEQLPIDAQVAEADSDQC